MSISDIAIKKPVFAWMIMGAFILFGAISFTRLGVSQLPDVDFPNVNVGVSLGGAAPEVIENQVIDVLEDALMGIQGIKAINSNSRQGSGSISIEFNIEKDIDSAVQEVQSRIAQVRSMLPADMDSPTIRKINPEDQPIMWLVLTSEQDVKITDTMAYAKDTLFNMFSTIKGVGDIQMGGYVDPMLRIWVSNSELKKRELTVTDVITSIKSNHQEVPAGRIENPLHEFNVRLMGEANKVEDFGKIPITLRSGRTNYLHPPLSNVATIEDGLADIRRMSRFMGKRAIGLGILKQHGSNSIEVAEAVTQRLKEVQPLIPKGMNLDLRVDMTRFVKASIHELNFTLIMAAILTSIVCFFFLGSLSSTFNVLMAIPTSIVGTFLVIHFFGFTLNTFTLLGLSLAIGIVVDDAIMMLENIMRHFGLGKSRVRASFDGANEITFAAVAATVAVVAIFLPVVFMTGVIGKYFFQFGITVTAAVLLSLLEALTLTPMRSSRFLTPHEKIGRIGRTMNYIMDILTRMYSWGLRISLRFRWLTIIASIGLFVGSLYLFKLVPSEMMPPQDQSQFIMRMKMPPGSSIDATNEKAKIVEEYLSKIPEINGYYLAVGGFGGDSVADANVNITLVPKSERKRSQQDIIQVVKTELTDILNPGKKKKDPEGGGERKAEGGGERKAEGDQERVATSDRTGKEERRGGATDAHEAGDRPKGDRKRGDWEGKRADREKREGKPDGEPKSAEGEQKAEGSGERKAEVDRKGGGERGGGGRGGGRGGRRGGRGDGIQIVAQDLSMRGFSSSRGFPVEFNVQGPNWDILGKATTDFIEFLNKGEVVADANTDFQRKLPEITLTPDRDAAAARGVNINTITQTVNSLVGGVSMGSQSRYFKNGHRYDIRLRLVPDEREQKDQLANIFVRNNRSELIPLSALVELSEKPAQMQISRRNR